MTPNQTQNAKVVQNWAIDYKN